METIYLTYDQWKRIGFQVKKGEKARRLEEFGSPPSLKFSEHQVKRNFEYNYEEEEDCMFPSESDIY